MTKQKNSFRKKGLLERDGSRFSSSNSNQQSLLNHFKTFKRKSKRHRTLLRLAQKPFAKNEPDRSQSFDQAQPKRPNSHLSINPSPAACQKLRSLLSHPG
jgi:hypothetical protein